MVGLARSTAFAFGRRDAELRFGIAIQRDAHIQNGSIATPIDVVVCVSVMFIACGGVVNRVFVFYVYGDHSICIMSVRLRFDRVHLDAVVKAYRNARSATLPLWRSAIIVCRYFPTDLRWSWSQWIDGRIVAVVRPPAAVAVVRLSAGFTTVVGRLLFIVIGHQYGGFDFHNKYVVVPFRMGLRLPAAGARVVEHEHRLVEQMEVEHFAPARLAYKCVGIAFAVKLQKTD